MNILVLSWRDPKHSLAGGAEQVMHEHMKGWIKGGHSVTLFSSRIKDYPRKEEILDGVKIVRGGIQFFGVQLAALWYYLRNLRKFDLIVDEFHGLPFFTPFYVTVPKLAVIQEVAGKVWLKNDLPKPFNWVVGVIGYLGEPLLFLFYRHIPFMTASESTKKSLVKFGIPEKNIAIVPHGVILPRSKILDLRSRIKTVIYLGAITLDKGIDQASRVFSILNKKGKFNFWVVGRAGDRYQDYLKTEAKKLKLGRNFKFFGFVDNQKKFNLLARAHVLINPSILEGWGLVNIEANAMGTPVVAYNSPGLTDSVKDGVSGVVVKKNRPYEMAGAVESILENREKYKRLSIGARAWSKNFSWEKSKNKSLMLVDSIVPGKYSLNQ